MDGCFFFRMGNVLGLSASTAAQASFPLAIIAAIALVFIGIPAFFGLIISPVALALEHLLGLDRKARIIVDVVLMASGIFMMCKYPFSVTQRNNGRCMCGVFLFMLGAMALLTGAILTVMGYIIQGATSASAST